MSATSSPDLIHLGRAAALDIAGPEAVEQIEVTPGEDAFDRPAYHFSFLVNPERTTQRPGLILIHLTRRLLEDLEARGDHHRPTVTLLNRADWDKRHGA